jgi:hypothetical protein
MDWTNLECNDCGANESNNYNPTDSKLDVCKRCGNKKMVNAEEICNHCFVFDKKNYEGVKGSAVFIENP